MSNEIQNSVLDAMQIIADRAIATADFDKTIKGLIVEVTDPTVGEYRIKYQGNNFYAYTDNLDVVYSAGTNVYVTVPNNDMTKRKVIIGAVDPRGTDYISALSMDEKFVELKNIFDYSKEYKLNSQKGVDSLLEQNSYTNDISELEVLKVSCDITTSLGTTQQYAGRYGIRFDVSYTQANGKEVTESINFSSNDMSGNPYLYTNRTSRTKFFNIKDYNITSIGNMEIYCEGFEENDTLQGDSDIIISNVKLIGGRLLTEAELQGCKVAIKTPQGSIFEDNLQEIELIANVRVDGRYLPQNSTAAEYYWFKEDYSVDRSDINYSNIGGTGWLCLNEGMPVTEYATDAYGNPKKDDNNDLIIKKAYTDWSPGTSHLKVQKSEATARTIRYKCVVIYDTQQVTEYITITNPDVDSYLSIETLVTDAEESMWDDILPLNETSFYDGVSVICRANYVGLEEIDHYAWRITDASGYSTSYDEDTNGVGNMRVNKNYFSGIETSKIFIQETISCAAYTADNKMVDEASIVITKDAGDAGGYSAVITNGNRLFQYDENGWSPTSDNNKNKITLEPLGFRVYDEKNVDITEGVQQGKTAKWKWMFPGPEGTMIMPAGDSLVIENATEVEYNIADAFDYNSLDNTVVLTITLDSGQIITAKSEFTFTKYGDIGTNGTGVTCLLKGNGIERPIIDVKKKETVDLTSELFYGVQKYDESLGRVEVGYDFNTLIKDQNNGWLEYTSEEKSQTIKVKDNLNTEEAVIKDHVARVKYTRTLPTDGEVQGVTLNGIQTYIDMIPIVTKWGEIDFDNDSGYINVLYNSDGTNPKYMDKPFKVYSKIGNKYEWSSIPTNLFIFDDDTKASVKVTPTANYDGRYTYTAIQCKISKGDEQIGYIHIPIIVTLNTTHAGTIDGWDGTSISTDNEGGMLIAPQVGAGYKNDKNQFTGIVIGTYAKDKTEKEDAVVKTGLLGYGEGKQTIFMDAKTGRVELGLSGSAAGQIIFDPSGEENTAIITGGTPDDGEYPLKLDLTEGVINAQSGQIGSLKLEDGGLKAEGDIPEQDYLTIDENGLTIINDGVQQVKLGIDEIRLGQWIVSDGAITSVEGKISYRKLIKNKRNITVVVDGVACYLPTYITPYAYTQLNKKLRSYYGSVTRVNSLNSETSVYTLSKGKHHPTQDKWTRYDPEIKTSGIYLTPTALRYFNGTTNTWSLGENIITFNGATVYFNTPDSVYVKNKNNNNVRLSKWVTDEIGSGEITNKATISRNVQIITKWKNNKPSKLMELDSFINSLIDDKIKSFQAKERAWVKKQGYLTSLPGHTHNLYVTESHTVKIGKEGSATGRFIKSGHTTTGGVS